MSREMSVYSDDMHILQAMPPGDWCATYEQDGAVFAEPLVAWVLVEYTADNEPEPFREVRGLTVDSDGMNMFPTEAENFRGYAHKPLK